MVNDLLYTIVLSVLLLVIVASYINTSSIVDGWFVANTMASIALGFCVLYCILYWKKII
jgi:hypothetical protein